MDCISCCPITLLVWVHNQGGGGGLNVMSRMLGCSWARHWHHDVCVHGTTRGSCVIWESSWVGSNIQQWPNYDKLCSNVLILENIIQKHDPMETQPKCCVMLWVLSKVLFTSFTQKMGFLGVVYTVNHKAVPMPCRIWDQSSWDHFGSGGALYIMFENRVRSWPLLKPPLYTRGCRSKYFCTHMYFILNICTM